jgi:hypothetical protein
MAGTLPDPDIEALHILPDDGPVTMLNLMHFRDRSRDAKGNGWSAYLRYGAQSIKPIKGVDDTIVWTGEARAVALGVSEAHRRDHVALVRHPSRAAFPAMMASPGRQLANVERENCNKGPKA